MTRTRGTVLGVLGIAGWSCYGVLLASNSVTPPFMSMAIVFSCATATLLIWRMVRGRGLRRLFTIPAATLGLGVLGLFGSNCLYALALAVGGNPISVNIALLSWPVFMVVFIIAFRVARATWLDAVAMLFGFSGVSLLTIQKGGTAFDWPVLLAVTGAICWALYSSLRTRVPSGPPDAMLAFVATSGLACWAIAFASESGTPPGGEIMRLALVGIVPVGLANLAWDFGARHGDPVLLAGLSFMEPVLSTALIALILLKPVNLGDMGALGLVLMAVFSSIMSDRLRRRRSCFREGVQQPG